MQTVLGAGGPIANIIARSLPDYCERIRLVSRNPKAVNRGDELFAADLLQPKLVDAAIAGSEVVYLCPGLLYKSSVWEQQWPVVMQNTINSCEKFGARLVFFDNVYAYGQVTGEMTENTPFNPCSRKGEVRAKIATQLLDAMQQGRVEAMIARSADFYGPATPYAMLTFMVFDNLNKGKGTQWMIRTDLPHSFTFTPDAGQVTALLGNTPDAFGQTWHLPTDPAPWTPAQFIEEVHRAYGHNGKPMVLGKGMMKLLSWFIPVLRETLEMQYQNEQAYHFSSAKILNELDIPFTPYARGLKETIQYYQKLRKK
jgi:nucleoside-diphosphate-sugar epimerase